MNASHATALLHDQGHGYGPDRSWKARLALSFAARPARTVMEGMDFEGPLRVQRPFYPENAPCHCYILHPPGGLVSGDRLRIEAHIAPAAHALLTTPSAGKIYAADSHNVLQGQKVCLTADHGICEWLPMETIVFDGANALLETTLDLTGSARCIGWDILCLGRPEGEHPFRNGRVVQTLRITRDTLPLVHERLDLTGGDPILTSPFGLGGHPISGTFYAVGPEQTAHALVSLVRQEVAPPRHGIFAVTARLGVLMARYLGDHSQEARALFEQTWEVIRPAFLDRPACPPRIWFT